MGRVHCGIKWVQETEEFQLTPGRKGLDVEHARSKSICLIFLRTVNDASG